MTTWQCFHHTPFHNWRSWEVEEGREQGAGGVAAKWLVLEMSDDRDETNSLLLQVVGEFMDMTSNGVDEWMLPQALFPGSLRYLSVTYLHMNFSHLCRTIHFGSFGSTYFLADSERQDRRSFGHLIELVQHLYAFWVIRRLFFNGLFINWFVPSQTCLSRFFLDKPMFCFFKYLRSKTGIELY